MHPQTLLSEFVVNVTFVINHYVMLYQQEKRSTIQAVNKPSVYKYIHEGLQAITRKYATTLKKSGGIHDKSAFLKELKEKNLYFATRLVNKLMSA